MRMFDGPVPSESDLKLCGQLGKWNMRPCLGAWQQSGHCRRQQLAWLQGLQAVLGDGKIRQLLEALQWLDECSLQQLHQVQWP